MARSRRPMSAATKAKIAAAQKGNKNAYKGGPKKRGSLGGKRDKATGIKTKRNTGYGKRRAAANLVGVAAIGALALGSPRTLVGKGIPYRNKRGPIKGGIPHRNAPGPTKRTKSGIPYRNAPGPTKGRIPHRNAAGPTKYTRGKSNVGNINARAGLAVAIGAAVAASHKKGMAKRSARKNGTVLVVRKRNGKINAYQPVAKKKKSKKKK